VALNNGEFTITCEGDNVNQFGVWITAPGATPNLLMIPINQNSITYDPDQTGTYTFQCQAWGDTSDPFCPAVYGEVVDYEEYYSDPAIDVDGPDADLTCGDIVTYRAYI